MFGVDDLGWPEQPAASAGCECGVGIDERDALFMSCFGGDGVVASVDPKDVLQGLVPERPEKRLERIASQEAFPGRAHWRVHHDEKHPLRRSFLKDELQIEDELLRRRGPGEPRILCELRETLTGTLRERFVRLPGALSPTGLSFSEPAPPRGRGF